MIVVDANVLLFAHHEGVPQHARARAWVESVFSGTEPVALPWQSVTAFLRIATHRKVFTNPYSVAEAVGIVRSWFSAPAVGSIEPGERYWDIFSALLERSQVDGPLVKDASLAAIAMEVGATLATSDRDFRRFDGLKLIDPLQEG